LRQPFAAPDAVHTAKVKKQMLFAGCQERGAKFNLEPDFLVQHVALSVTA
jgi:hypothetical protein